MKTIDSAVDALRIWGLRTGGKLVSPLPKVPGSQFTPKGEESEMDDELSLSLYVQEIRGFERSRSILAHVYANGKTIGTYRFREPGETFRQALDRHQFFRMGGHEDDFLIVTSIHDEFVYQLSESLMKKPWYPPIKEDAKAIAERELAVAIYVQRAQEMSCKSR